MATQKPRHWFDVYPQGSSEGDDEYRLFVILARHPKYAWRSVADIVNEAGLAPQRVGEILKKYNAMGMVFPNAKGEWGYWKRVSPERL